MKIGINLFDTKCVPLREQLNNLTENGFESVFFGSDAPDAAEIARELKRCNLHCDSLHAPFGHINAMWLEGENGERMLRELTDGVETCARIEAPVLVVHLSSGEQAPCVNDLGFSRFDRLMEFAAKNGVTVAYENQRKLGNLACALERYPDAGFCWDVGHEACFMRGIQTMPLFGKRIVALHTHDNHAVFNGDEHLLPGDGAIDFERVARQLADSPFAGTLMLEVSRFSVAPYRALTHEEFYRRAAERARTIAERVERLRLEKHTAQ